MAAGCAVGHSGFAGQDGCAAADAAGGVAGALGAAGTMTGAGGSTSGATICHVGCATTSVVRRSAPPRRLAGSAVDRCR